eukprot:TRINITY_DN104757_c0_g1_i1.p1 TRINITY_DN104757_c0_g1~~TRINITY_DN104757_c0_g1_i1.p1  ORF type:complete len:134 (-),score=10.08 TRINITY_DN104757_c0_g1_i1:18-419(-)
MAETHSDDGDCRWKSDKQSNSEDCTAIALLHLLGSRHAHAQHTCTPHSLLALLFPSLVERRLREKLVDLAVGERRKVVARERHHVIRVVADHLLHVRLQHPRQLSRHLQLLSAIDSVHRVVVLQSVRSRFLKK